MVLFTEQRENVSFDHIIKSYYSMFMSMYSFTFHLLYNDFVFMCLVCTYEQRIREGVYVMRNSALYSGPDGECRFLMRKWSELYFHMAYIYLTQWGRDISNEVEYRFTLFV